MSERLTPIAVGSTWDYTIPTDTDDPTVWKLRILDQLAAYGLGIAVFNTVPEADEIGETGAVPVEHFVALEDACRIGIAGWSNLKDADGNEVEYRSVTVTRWGRRYDIVPDEILVKIPMLTKQILGMEIVRGNSLSEDARKNSARPGPLEKDSGQTKNSTISQQGSE